MTNTTHEYFEHVDVLLRAAFEADDEASLIRKLRHDNDLAHEVVLEGEQGLIGYAALSNMTEPKGWMCLAPVAVSPSFQRRGHGKNLLAKVLAWAAERGATVAVVGNPDYYGANGFSTKRAARLQTRYPVEYTLLAGPGDDILEKTLIYPAAFDDLD